MDEPPQIPIAISHDSDRLQRIKAGLNKYFAAVSLRNISPEDKLKAISVTFNLQAELITKQRTFQGRDDIVNNFYASPASPVMKDPDFRPDPHLDTMCVSGDENTIAIEIALTKDFIVGDWFTFDAEGKILRLRVFT